uniref:Vps16 N-terminal domain-containing protein n=1 Tax=Timema shepardi TaxID=629360 RepID=A0A7R9AWN6_TIMSH|nr:unnamed protein product [Timema shepardi]
MASLVLTDGSQLTSDSQHLGMYSSPTASLVLTDSSQLTSDSQHLGMYSSPVASLVLTDGSQLTSDSQHLGIYSSPVASLVLTDISQLTYDSQHLADWCPLGKDTYFRKFEIYSMAWQNEINLDNVVLAAASYGGPVAVVRDRKRFIKVQTTGKPVISIYTASGRQMSSIVWTGGQIIHLGWSSTEDLLCVQNDGCVLAYDMFGTYLHTFGMGQEAKDTNIIEAKIFASVNGTGVVVLTSSYRFFLVNNVKEPKVRQLAEVAGLTVPPSSWCVISEDRHTRVLMARGSDLYLLKHSEQHAFPVGLDLRENTKSVVEMAVSHNNRHVALFTDLGHLWIGSADMRKKYCEFDTKCPSRPRQLVWCGTEAVVGHWDTVLLVVNRQGEFINYSYDSPVHLLPEMDGVRVLSAFTHEMIQKVPLVVQQIFRINSTEPGSYLLEASKQFQKRSHRSDEYIRLVKDQLNVAVRQCIDAAGYEFDPSNQMMLIRAAQFGKSFVPDIDSEPYVKMCRTLRVLNAGNNHTENLTCGAWCGLVKFGNFWYN